MLKLFVNAKHIKQNSLLKQEHPVLIIQDIDEKGVLKNQTYANEVIIYGKDGQEAARLVYDPTKSGGRVWVQTENDIKASM